MNSGKYVFGEALKAQSFEERHAISNRVTRSLSCAALIQALLAKEFHNCREFLRVVHR
jgi:hypothetical protein